MRKAEFIAKVQSDLQLKTRHTKTSIEKLALTYGITDKNTAKEFTELAIVLEARRLAHQIKPVEARFYDIVELYDLQVNLSHRTSQSMLLQQYSTPAPIGFLGGIFCGFNNSGSYFEPSAGNGLLTIAGDQKNFIVNEIDDTRRENLEDQGYKLVTGKDATQPFNQYKHTFDAIISNPPFGVIDPEVEFDGVSFGVLDHVMCIQALNTMKDLGRAALIIGGHTTWDDKGRIQAGKNRTFFSYLYKHYNVLDVINIDGYALYSKQGTAFNVRLILIDGRKNNPGGFPPLQDKNVNPVVFSYSELYNRVSKYFVANTDKNNFTSDMELEAEALTLELGLMSLSGIGSYDSIKESMSDIFNKIIKNDQSLSNKINFLEKYKSLKEYIVDNLTSNGSLSFIKSSPDEFEEELEVYRRKYDGGWDESNKTIKVVVQLRKISQSNKYKYYQVEKIINDNGLQAFINSQIPIIESEIERIKSENKKLQLEQKELENKLLLTENPHKKRNEQTINCLLEAERIAVSSIHKKNIQKTIAAIENGEIVRNRDAVKVWYTGAKQFVSNLIKKLGGVRYHKSGKSVAGSVYYNLPNGVKIRISDHELPDTEVRRYNRSIGVGGDWIEFVLEDLKPFSEIKLEILENLLDYFEYADNSELKKFYEEKTESIKEKINKLLI